MMDKAVKEAGAVGNFVAANKMPIATGATAMALAALLSKRNRLAKALGWGAVGAGLGKAGQLYLDAYKRQKKQADRDAFEKALSATDGAGLTAQPSYDLIPLGFNYDPKNHGGKKYGQGKPVTGVAFRERGDNREPITSKVPSMPLTSTDYLKRQEAKAQEPVLNTDLPGVSPRIQAAIAAAKLLTREERQQAREKELAALQSEGYGSQFLKNMVTGTGEALKEMATSSAAPVVDLYNRVKGDVGAINKARGSNKEAKKNIKRMRDELEAKNAPRRKETLLDRVMRRLSK